MSEKLTGRVIRDPYSVVKPFRIAGRLPADDESKSGWVLGWKSERLRNNSGIGWRGWIPLEYGDRFTGENGEKLKDCIPDPPRRMQGPDHIDNLVRRADTILCRIQADYFDDRQAKSAEESRSMVAELTTPENQEILPGVTTIGGGRKADKNPTFGGQTEADKQLSVKFRQ